MGIWTLQDLKHFIKGKLVSVTCEMYQILAQRFNEILQIFTDNGSSAFEKYEPFVWFVNKNLFWVLKASYVIYTVYNSNL